MTNYWIFNVNDLHGGSPRGSTNMLEWSRARIDTIQEWRDRVGWDNSLVVNVGDLLRLEDKRHPRTLPEINAERSALIREMNRVGCEIFTPGDHCLEGGLRKFFKNINGLKAKVVTANIATTARTPLKGFQSFKIAAIKPWNIKIAFVGITTPPRYTSSLVDENMLYWADQTVKEVKSRGAKAVVFLAHASHRIQKELAALNLREDLLPVASVIAGHSHSIRRNPMKLHGTLITEAGFSGSHIGFVKLGINAESMEIKALAGTVAVRPRAWIR